MTYFMFFKCSLYPLSEVRALFGHRTPKFRSGSPKSEVCPNTIFEPSQEKTIHLSIKLLHRYKMYVCVLILLYCYLAFMTYFMFILGSHYSMFKVRALFGIRKPELRLGSQTFRILAKPEVLGNE